MMTSPRPLSELMGLAHVGEAQSHPRPAPWSEMYLMFDLERAGMVIVRQKLPYQGAGDTQSSSVRHAEGEMHFLSGRR
jgi:hypothetical protein